MALNARQKQFITEYIVSKNATKAAEAAGYSKKTAHSQGPRLLEHVEIRAEIEKVFNYRRMKAEVKLAKAGMTKERWLEELALIATSNIDDHVKVTVKTTKNGTHGTEYMLVETVPTATTARPRELGRSIKKISETKHGISIELHSKQAALDTLGRAFGWVKDQVEVSGPGGGPQVVVNLPANGREVLAHTQTEEIKGKDDEDSGGK